MVAEELEMLMNAGRGDVERVKRLASDLRLKYPGTETEKRSLILLASLGGFSESQRATSTQALTELKKKYVVDEGLLASLGSMGAEESKSTQETLQSGDLALSNHPNPFLQKYTAAPEEQRRTASKAQDSNSVNCGSASFTNPATWSKSSFLFTKSRLSLGITRTGPIL